jgi:DHA3 family macrolide efflux protein-like MFS transporter
MAAGALLTFIPIGNIFFIDVTTAIIGIVTVLFFVKVTHTAKAPSGGSGAKAYIEEIKEGLRYIRGEKWLTTLFVATAAFMILAAPSAMMTPLQVTRSFGVEVWRLTAIEIAFSLGMMAGGIAIAAWGGFKNKAYSMLLAWLLYGLSTLLFGVVNNFAVYLGVMVFCGCVMPLYNTPSMTLLQVKIPPNLMGRVFSVMSMIAGIAMPLGMALFGPLGDIISIEAILISTGALLLAGGLLLFKRKELIEAGKPESKAV